MIHKDCKNCTSVQSFKINPVFKISIVMCFDTVVKSLLNNNPYCLMIRLTVNLELSVVFAIMGSARSSGSFSSFSRPRTFAFDRILYTIHVLAVVRAYETTRLYELLHENPHSHIWDEVLCNMYYIPLL